MNELNKTQMLVHSDDNIVSKYTRALCFDQYGLIFTTAAEATHDISQFGNHHLVDTG